MFEFCPHCANPWSDIELEYQFCKDCGYQSPSDIDCMWDRIRKRINVLNELKGSSEELEEVIHEQEYQILLRESELRRIDSEINIKRQELNRKAEYKKAETDRFTELFEGNPKKDIGTLFRAVCVIIKWAYLAFSFSMLFALTLGLFGLPIILIVETSMAWWQSILIIIPFWLFGIGLLFHFIEEIQSKKRKQRVIQNESLLSKEPEMKKESLAAKTLRFMWIKARVEQLKKEREMKQKVASGSLPSSSTLANDPISSILLENDNPITNGVLPKECAQKREKDKEDLTVKLDSGETVKIHSFSFSSTYSGLISGRIDDEEFNTETFDSASYPKNWGVRKVLKIKPDSKEFQKGFKECCFSVWLTSSIPVAPGYDGSELVVIWFNDLIAGASIKEIVQSAVRSINWEGNAQDFEY